MLSPGDTPFCWAARQAAAMPTQHKTHARTAQHCTDARMCGQDEVARRRPAHGPFVLEFSSLAPFDAGLGAVVRGQVLVCARLKKKKKLKPHMRQHRRSIAGRTSLFPPIVGTLRWDKAIIIPPSFHPGQEKEATCYCFFPEEPLETCFGALRTLPLTVGPPRRASLPSGFSLPAPGRRAASRLFCFLMRRQSLPAPSVTCLS